MSDKSNEKILVLATAQKNSLRLIDYGFSVSLAVRGELHILNIQKGSSVFGGKDSLKRLQELVDYGSRLGAAVHVLCGEDVAECVEDFVKKEDITAVILGESLDTGLKNEEEAIIAAVENEVRVAVVPREEFQLERRIG